MTTIVNTPASNESGSIGTIVGLIIVVVLGVLFFMYGLPAIRQMLPGTTQINVPDKIDVNVNQTN